MANLHGLASLGLVQGLALNRSYHGLACIALCLLSGLTGCALDPGLVPPSASVESVRVIDQTAEGSRLEVLIRMENPNLVSLPLPSVNFTLTLKDVGTFAFTDTPHITLPAKRNDGEYGPGIQFLKLPAAIATQGKDSHGAAYQVSGAIVYEPPGEIRRLMTESNVPLPTMNFSQAGTVE